MTDLTIYKSTSLTTAQRGDVIVAGEKLPRAVREGIVALDIAFPSRAMDVAQQAVLYSVYGAAVAGFEPFIAAFTLSRACIRPPDPRFRPTPAQIEELGHATRNALRRAVVQYCLNGSDWYVGLKDLPDRWFGDFAAAAPFSPQCPIPDDVASRWIREHIQRTESVDKVRKVAEWTARYYRADYWNAPDCLRGGYSPAAIKRLPDDALPAGFRAAYEAAVERLVQLHQEENAEREKEAAASRERRGKWINNPDREQPRP